MLHPEIQDNIPLLALGGLDGETQTQLEQHLTICPTCRAQLAEYTFVAQELNVQVPPLTAPPELEARLMAQLPPQTTRANYVTSSARGDAPKGFWRQPVRLSRFAVALAIAIGLLLVGTAAAFQAQLQIVRATNAQPVSQAYALENLKLVPLSGATNGPDGYIYLAPNNPTAMLWLTKMNPLDADHAYQLWLIKDGTRASGGTFRPGSDGRAIVFVHAPEPWSQYQEVGVTIEPASGSPKPTTPRVIGGKLY